MDDTLRAIIWHQFGAAIDSLEDAVKACPENLWDDSSRKPEFWYVAYHTLFFLDYYSSRKEEGFSPPAPFTLDELDHRGVMPERPYTREELQAYLMHGRRKCLERLRSLTEEEAYRPCEFRRKTFSVLELQLYSMRHVQHHAAQLNMLLRQRTDSAPRWVATARDPFQLDSVSETI